MIAMNDEIIQPIPTTGDGIGGLDRVLMSVNAACTRWLKEREDNYRTSKQVFAEQGAVMWAQARVKRQSLSDKVRGMGNSHAKLTDEKVIEIFTSTEPATEVAKRYGVDRTTVSHIRRGISWTHVTSKIPASAIRTLNPTQTAHNPAV